MARRTAGLGRTVAALTLAVLLMHWAALAWLASRWHEPSVLQPMATPMLTRQIVPTAPPHPPAPILKKKVTTAPVKHKLVATKSIAIEAPAPPVVADATPEPPDAASSPGATAPEAAASAPQAVASEPAGSGNAPLDGTPSAPESTQSFLDVWPDDTRLTYRLGGNYRGALHGDAQVLWQRDVDRYQTRIDVDIGWLVSMTLTSQGRITPQGLFPRAYEEVVRSKRRSVVLDQHDVTLANGNTVARPDGVQDTVSQFIELAYQFTTGQTALQVGQSIDLWLARPAGVDLWTYDVVEEVTLQTPRLGSVLTFHVKPRPLSSPGGNITVEMWFAPSLQYLPVRIRLNLDKDTYVDLMVDKIEQR